MEMWYHKVVPYEFMRSCHFVMQFRGELDGVDGAICVYMWGIWRVLAMWFICPFCSSEPIGVVLRHKQRIGMAQFCSRFTS